MASMNKVKLGFLLVVVVAISSFATSIYAGSSNIVLCANVKTGSLRYSKGGACSKQESKLSINPNGVAGPSGAVGPVGSAGAVGPAGSSGKNGLNSVYLQDAAGTIFTYVPNTYTNILWNGSLWILNSGTFSNSTLPALPAVYFLDAACSIPIFERNYYYGFGISSQSTMVTTSDGNVLATSRVLKAYKPKGSSIRIDTSRDYYFLGGNGETRYCTVMPGGRAINDSERGLYTDAITDYYEAEEIEPLVFVPPLKFVVG